MRWQTALILMAAVYVLNRAFGFLYATYPDIDIPMHILGGFLVACLGLGLWRDAARLSGAKNVPPVAVAMMMVSFAALVAVAWEFHEYVLDWYHRGAGVTPYIPMQPSQADTIKDLADGLIGACIATLVFRKRLDEVTSVVKRK